MSTPEGHLVVIKDIAKLCNVSPQTVSRVLNQRNDVSPETRSRIERVIAETGYQPSILARSLANRRKFKSGADVEWENNVDLTITRHSKLQILPNSMWVMTGDSITACQRDLNNSADLGKGYVSFIDGLLTARYPFHHIRVLNQGVPGNTVRELQSRWQTDVINLNPDWLSVCIGINDVWQQFDGNHEGQSLATLTEYEHTLDKLLTITRPKLKGLVLMTPYFIQPRGEPMRTMMDAYSAAVQCLAQKYQAIFVDTQAFFDSAVEHVSVETLTWDRVHLTIPGHMILARAVLQSVCFEWSEI